MTFLFRKIGDVRAWKHAFERDEIVPAGEIPLWAHSEFWPRSNDDGGISVFELDDDREQLQKLGSAFHMVVEDDLLFVGVPKDAVTAAGLNVEATQGRMFDVEVNAWHREIRVHQYADVAALTALYVAGEPRRTEKGVAFKTLQKQTRAARVALMNSFSGGAFAKSQTVRLVGNAATIVHQP